MQKITTHLWFDKEAKEAAKFYTTVFPSAKIKSTNVIRGTPSGDVDIIDMEILGENFTFISAGSLFKFNPTISFVVESNDEREVDRLWKKLLENGKVLMPMQTYPFSKKYGWLQDKYGVSWQISVVMNSPGIYPCLMFIGKNFGRCEEAINFYTKVFNKSKIDFISRYEKGEHDKPGAVKWAMFHLGGKRFSAIESSLGHKFDFNEAVSLMVNCENQGEIDYYWGKLSAVPAAEQCGWLKDKYGVSWQIVPSDMNKYMRGSPDKVQRVTESFLKMKKFDLAKLKGAYDGK